MGASVERMRFGVESIVVKIANERAERVRRAQHRSRGESSTCGSAPPPTWVRGRFTLAEMMEGARADAAIIDLRNRIDLVPDAYHKTFEGASLEVFFTDGTTDTASWCPPSAAHPATA